jgi:Protein of unknown function (DUF4232)
MTSAPRIATTLTRPRFALAGLSVVSGLALAGCASGSQGQASPPTASTSSAAAAGSAPVSSSAPAAQPSITPGGPMASPPTGSAAECRAAVLKIAYSDNKQILNGALDGMSHADSVVMFTNVGSAACRTQGWPGIAALDSSGRQIKQAVRGTGGKVPLITLRPGQTASAEITANTASCSTLTTVAGFLVTAPDQRTSTRLSGPKKFCLNSLGIAPMQPGNAAGLFS